VRPTEQIAKPAATLKAGLFATLGGPFRRKGIGAPKIAAPLAHAGVGGALAPRRFALVSLLTLVATLGALACAAAPVLAAPEAPTNEKVKEITASGATVEGELNPNKPGEAGEEYDFYWRNQEPPGPGSGCTEGYTDYRPDVAPEPAGLTLGFKNELEVEHISGLEPNDYITICLGVTNDKGEQTFGKPITFKTLALPPDALRESVANLKATEATLEAVVNANGEPTTYFFEYSTKATGEKLEGAIVKTAKNSAGNQYVGEKGVATATGPVLEPNTTYYYRVITENEQSEKEGKRVEGQVESFTTPIAPETPEGEEAKPIASTTATLHGVLNPHNMGNPSSYQFLYRESPAMPQYSYEPTPPAECQGGQPSEDEATPVAAATGATPEPVEAEIKGLLPGANYTFCLRTKNPAGETALGAPVTFTTLPAAPLIASESVAGVESSGVTLQAEIVPNGAATTYHFEYGTTEAYGQETSAETIEGLTGTNAVNAHITDLEPNTTYHYRVTATNEVVGKLETTHGLDVTFTTPILLGSEPGQNCPNEQRRGEQPYGLKLPDCRAYEMASPLITLGNDASSPYFRSYARAAVSGEAVTYQSYGVFANPIGSTVDNQYVSRRGPEGWSTQNVTPLHHPNTTDIRNPYPGAIFTPELTAGITTTTAALVAGAPEGAEEGSRSYTSYRYEFANQFFQYLGDGESGTVAAASTDLSHVVNNNYEYYYHSPEFWVEEWVNGTLVKVSVNNKGEEMSASSGGPNAISADGHRVFFESGGAVYLRENAEQAQSPLGGGGECTVATDACTIEVNASQKTDGFGPKGVDPNRGSASYAGASADGSKVFFTSNQELTNEANTGVSDRQEVVVENAEGGTFTLTFKGQTTAPIPYNASSAELQSALETLSSVGAGNVAVSGGYEVTFKGTLAGSEQPPLTAGGSSLTGGTAHVRVQALERPGIDLYEYDVEDGKLTDLTPDAAEMEGARVIASQTVAFQAEEVVKISQDGSYVYFAAKGDLRGPGGTTLRNSQGSEPVAGESNFYVAHNGATRFIGTGGSHLVTAADGTHLAFESTGKLTGYDNSEAEGGECYYGSQGGSSCSKASEVYIYDAETGILECASCNPTGARPGGNSTPEAVTEDGVVFFNSSDALVPHASDGRQNVYEYENGHVQAISDVAGGFESFFLATDPSGNNVFFGSADQLLPEDTSNSVVVWDARVGGGYPVANTPPPCNSGDSCKPPPTPQPALFGEPASATFSGPGDIATPPPPSGFGEATKTTVKCGKGFTKNGKGKCVKQSKSGKKKKKKTKKSKKAKKASNDRRASR
jgi:hypothetical protein